MNIYRQNIRNLLLAFLVSSVGVSVPAFAGERGVVPADSLNAGKNEKKPTWKQDWKKIYGDNAYLLFDQGLMGNEPGAYTSRNGMVGNSGVIMLRGVNSVNLDASPYIIIDEVPVRYNRTLSPFVSGFSPANTGFINPLDITDMKILKGGYNTSLYGGKSSNGIITIGTDKGELNSAAIEVMARVGLQQANNGLDLMSAANFRAYLYDYMHNIGTPVTELEKNPLFDASHPKYNHNTDWFDQMQRNALFQEYQMKLRGGDGDTRYMFGVGYTSQEETMESFYNRFNMRINLDYRITPKISISNYLSYAYTSMRFFGQGVDWDVNPLYVAATKSPFFSGNHYSDAGIMTYNKADEDQLGKSNPQLFKDNLKNRGTGNRIDGVIKANWQINSLTGAHTTFSVSYDNTIEEMRRLSYGIVNDQYRERQNSKRNYSNFLMRWNTWLERNGKIIPEVAYNGKVGFIYEKNDEKSVYGRRVNASTDDFESLGYGDVDSITNLNYTHNLLNFYMAGGFRFFDRVSVNANMNLEGSSNFGTKGRWTLYGGVELGADLWKNEQHYIGLAGQWGRTGNNDVRGTYQSTLYYPTHYYSYGGVYLGNVANSNIRPEITNNYDAGVNVRLFNNMVDVYAGYYYKKTVGLLTQKALPMEIGLDPQFENNGDATNQGVEVALNVNVLERKSWKWSVFANVATLKNEVTNLKNGDIVRSYDKFRGIAREGEELGSFYGYKVLGIFNKTSDVNLLRTDGTPYLAGDYIMEDAKKDGIINELDMQVIGSPLPEFYGGFGTNLSYKGLSFSAMFSYSYGNDVYNLFKQKLNSMSDFSNQSALVNGRWISEEVNGAGYLPRAAYGDPSGNFAASDRWVEDGSYLRLKTLAVGYDIPLKNRSGFLKGIRVFANLNNLFTVTGYSGFDPEVFSSADPLLRGVDTGTSPNPRSYVFGVKIAL